MAKAAKKNQNQEVNETQLKLLYGEDSLTKYWSSSLFNTVYLKHDISEKHSAWLDEDSVEFQNFMNTLRDFAAEYKNRDKELQNWSETETINSCVKHLLHALGWGNNCTGVQNPYLEETSFRYEDKTYRTDILLVDHPKEKQYVNQARGDGKIVEARQSVIMPVEVKYWNRLEEYRQGVKEEKKRSDAGLDDISRTSTPNQQIVQYMEILKKSWGILTDGARWRLFNYELSSEDVERYYEFNFYSLLQALCTEETEADSREIIDAAKYFFHFFSKSAFYPQNGEEPLVDEVLKYSRKYVNKIEEDLKIRFVKAMNIACNALHKSAKKQGVDADLFAIRNVSESALFNVLFIKSLESRGILPMAATDYKKLSLSSIMDKLEKFDPEKEDLLNCRELERSFIKGNGNSFKYDSKMFELHDRILKLTGIIHKGATSKDNFGFEIAGFKESVFSTDEWQIFKNCKIQNHDWVRILFELGYAESESKNRKYQQIPYSYFTPRQLGSIYESFLEFKIDKATEGMVFEKHQWFPADINSKKYKFADIPKVEKGDLFFTPDNEDRKATGSYYTPHYVVEFIIKNTFDRDLANLKSKDVLNFRIIDPAMGSGHFLSSALNYLATDYLKKLEKETRGDIEENLTLAKRKVLPNCIFGVDINPRAVKLAKMSLWLSTAAPGATLENLDDQLKTADSVGDSFKWEKEFPDAFKTGGFDAVIGNPPYRKERESKKLMEEIKASKYGELYYEGKMDLWYFFLHRAIEIVKDDAKIGFIVPTYWLKSAGSSKLIERIKNDAGFSVVVDFKKNKIFDDVSGQHMVFIVEKGLVNGPLSYTSFQRNDLKPQEILNLLYQPSDMAPRVEIERSGVFTEAGFIDFDSYRFEKVLSALEKNNYKLEDDNKLFEVSQGIVEAPDRINTELAKKLKAPHLAGKGVFVLTKKELAALGLNSEEKKFVKKYLHGEDVFKYGMNDSSHSVFYISSQDNKEIGKNKNKYPNLVKHFKEVEKAVTSSNAPYGLHRARESKYFMDEKLFCHNMFDKPSFSYSSDEIYVNFAFNVVIPGENSPYSLKYLLGLLNSKLGEFWFNRRGKKRGVNNDIGVGVLREFPIKKFDFKDKKAKTEYDDIIKVVTEIEKQRSIKRDSDITVLEAKLNKLVFAHYELSAEMIKMIEEADVRPTIEQEAA